MNAEDFKAEMDNAIESEKVVEEVITDEIPFEDKYRALCEIISEDGIGGDGDECFMCALRGTGGCNPDSCTFELREDVVKEMLEA